MRRKDVDNLFLLPTSLAVFHSPLFHMAALARMQNSGINGGELNPWPHSR